MGLCGDFFEGVVGKNQDFMSFRLFNPNDLIGCGGDINQSDSVDLCGSTQVYVGVYMGVYVGLHGDFFEGVVGKKSRFYVN